MEYVVILAGGSGTRLWPLSRQGMPKQLLTLVNGRSLLQLAVERATSVVDPSRVLICAGEAYSETVAEQLPDLPQENILGEPVGRDSLAASAWSTAVVARRDPEAVVAVLSADHIITPVESFADSLRRAFSAAARDDRALVTMGVTPTHPHTGFGYVRVGDPVPNAQETWKVERFAEKPDLETAKRYLAEGGWLWNSGMFCWRAETFLNQLTALQPVFASQIQDLTDHPERIREVYPALTKISVDYAVMEPTSSGVGHAHILVVSMTASWSDVGSFASLAEYMVGATGTSCEGRVVQLNSDGNVIINRAPDGHMIAVAGLHDTIVVESGNVTLVCPVQAGESIKALAQLAAEQGETYA